MSLYRKYRPQSFSNLVGQDHIRTTLMNALKGGRVNHAYLFTGPRGTGKTSTARLVAKAINCENLQNAEPCESCDICRDITDGRLIDLIEIDAASNRGIDEIRDLREKIQFAPTRAKSKVYIIDEVHMLTKEAFNALLKTLEEPPTHVYFILATTEVHKIPETILSRCQRFDFKRIDHQTLVARLGYIAEQEHISAEPDALDAIARVAQGGLRDAIGLLEQLNVDGKLTFEHVREVLGITGKASLEKLYGFLQSGDAKQGIEEVNGLYHEGYDLTQFSKDFLELLRQKMLEHVHEGNTNEIARILSWIEHFQHAYDGAKFATIPQLPLEVAVVQSCIPPVTTIAVDTRPHASVEPRPAPAVVHKSPASNTPPTAAAMVRRPVAVEPAVEISHQTLQKAAALSSEVLLTQWPHVVKAIKNVTAKRTLAAGKFSGLQGAEVHIAFGTQFHASKMKEFANRLAVEEALFTVFQVPLKVVAEVDPALAPPPEHSHSDATAAASPAAPLDEKTSQLLAMMGGEMVE